MNDIKPFKLTPRKFRGITIQQIYTWATLGERVYDFLLEELTEDDKHSIEEINKAIDTGKITIERDTEFYDCLTVRIGIPKTQNETCP